MVLESNLRVYLPAKTREWYLEIFGESSKPVTAEITPAYSTLPRDVVREATQMLPGVKGLRTREQTRLR